VATKLESETRNKLQVFEPGVNVINLFHFPRRDEIIILRLRIGPTYLTLGHLHYELLTTTFPRCSACQVELTVEQILFSCVFFYKKTRHDCLCVTLISQTDLLSKVVTRSIIDLIIETAIYRNIFIVKFKCMF